MVAHLDHFTVFHADDFVAGFLDEAHVVRGDDQYGGGIDKFIEALGCFLLKIRIADRQPLIH